MNQQPGVGFIIVSTAMVWLTMALAITAFWATYGSPPFVIMAVVTVLVGSAIAIIGARVRASSLVLLLATAGAFLLLGVPLAVPGKAIAGLLPSVDGLIDLIAGVALGWKQLLTISLPVGSFQALLVPAFALILVTVVITLSVALRARYGELAAIGPLAVYLVAGLFGPIEAQWPLRLTLGLVASVLLWLIWRRWYRRREAVRLLARQATDPAGPLETRPDGPFVGVRTLLSAGAIFAIAASTGVGAATLLPPGHERIVLRSSIEQPFDPRDYASPLVGFRAMLTQPEATRTLFTVDGLPPGTFIRVATLDTYDGIVYSVGTPDVESASGSFTRLPFRVDQSSVDGDEVTAVFTIQGYSDVWVPTVGKLVSIDFAGDRGRQLRDSFYYNDSTGSAAVLGSLDGGDSYTVTAVIPTQPTDEQLTSLEPNPLPQPPVQVVPDELAATLDRWVRNANGPGERLAAMLNGLRAEGFVSHGIDPDEPVSRSGHGADRITELLGSQRMIGDQEQYAVTAALMARELGFPARVVVGFSTDPTAGGSTIIRGNDITAWIEVNTARYGWVAIDPTPPERPIPAEVPEDPAVVARPQSPVQPPVLEPEQPDTQLPPESTQEQPPEENVIVGIVLRVLAVLGLSLVVAAIVLSPFITIVAAKWRRRRLRRKAPTAALRIAGGWREFEDTAIDHGVSPGAAPTRLEVAQAVGGTQPLVLASVADRAVFAPGNPSDEDADQVWSAVEELRYALGAGLTRWERLKALVSLRSLGGYSVSKLFRREGKPQ
ncbi:transglutaminaseTgpA domain-containing protein [Cryobacterium sp. BB307]|uniref:transglutaminase family protein n=1 Tax=Cryobacterium sp. BB307 TaxID=2716317 RepID=UPI0014478362|nr:transglutaminaseTgpA domain-containing protein [Cryobacterium sp. BB307]